MAYRLRGRVGGREQSYLLSDGEHSLGSAEANDLVLATRGVSRRHARLTAAGERFRIVDLGSTNGTFVDGERIERGSLTVGQRVRLGPVELELETVDRGDAELALVVEPPAADSARTAIDETTCLQPSTGDDATGPAHPQLVFPDGHVVGRSPAMERLYRELAAGLGSDLPVLIEGRTGVGKEHVVRILHASSPRSGGPLVSINCAAIPADLLEAELFGIAEGVATGVRERRGKFEQAAGGTLLLDEIGEMPIALQAKLLRALQEREIQPVGGAPRAIDARLVAATNLDLLSQVENGRFRRDLYYRIAGFVLRVPALAERQGDVPLLIEHFLRRAAAASGKAIRGLSKKALDLLTAYPWPGNVRELEHEVTRLVHLCPDGQAIDSSRLPSELIAAAVRQPPESPAATAPAGTLRLRDHVEALERRLIQEALERAGGSQRQAARLLAISRNALARKIRRFNIL